MTIPPPSAAPPTRALEHAPPPSSVDLSLVRELLRLFGKAARAHQLYLPNNPVYKAALDALHAGFTPVWAAADELPLAFTEDQVRCGGETVLEEAAKSSDSLPWLFYKDGVRELRFLRGFDTEELQKLLDILKRVRKASPDEDDLLTLLWEGDFAFLRYRYVDMTVDATVPLVEGFEALTDSHGEDRSEGGSTLTGGRVDREELAAAAKSAPANSVVNMADFDATLYFLDEREIDYIKSEIKREYESDLRESVTALVLDIFEQQADPKLREEVLETLDNLMLHMLSGGQFHTVGFLIREAQVAAARAIDLLPTQRERLAELPARLSTPDAITQLLHSMDGAGAPPRLEDLLALFDQLRGTALGTLLEWLGRTQNPALRPVLEQASSRLASQNTAELVKLIDSPVRSVSLEAIRRAGALQTPAAVGPLSRMLAEGDNEQRTASVQALSEIGSASALQGLERGLEDREREVRIATVRALQARAYRPALPRLEALVKGRAVRDADLSEKMAVFEAYGSMCGEGGVVALDAMLNAKSMFGRREDPEVRACAAIALGRIGTASAVAALQRSATEKDIVVRNAVSRALRGSST
ncbi:MAG TPA: HEAT repeat domain-containing protein [Gemmatimonadaceae bacterium]